MKLFEPGFIGKMRLKNRIVMAPMGNHLEELDGRASQREIDYFVARAKGGTGLITTGRYQVVRRNEGFPLAPEHVIDEKMYVTRLNELADAVHDYGAKISVQLHTGMGRTAPAKSRPLAPSVLPCFHDPSVMTREISIEEIEKLVQKYRVAAELAKQAGIDGVDIHAHKGGFIDQFMTSLWNRRTDRYGGDLENRLRFAVEIIQAIKKGAGADFPVTFRYGLTHYLAGGRGIDEGLEIARRLESAGADALLIDAGCEEAIYWIHPPTTLPPGCMVSLAEQVKKVVRIPVIAVGKLGYPDLAERMLQEGKADFIALGRTLLAEPEWANKVRQGRVGDIRPCLGCNEGCEARIGKGRYISCAVNPATGMERELAVTPAEHKKTVLVVGGGPAGMEAARVAALRGHEVTLWDKGEALGGNLIAASVPDFKQDYRRLLDYLISQVYKLGIAIELGKEATPELVERLKPDVVFVATGGTPVIPQIPGVEKLKVVTAVDLLLGKKKAGDSVVVIGGGVVGSEAALHLARQNKKVTLVEVLDGIARDIYKNNRFHLMELLDGAKVKVLTESNVVAITDEAVVLVDQSGKKSTLEADTVVLAVGFAPDSRLAAGLSASTAEVHTIGDCVEPRKVINAIWEAYRTARLI